MSQAPHIWTITLSPNPKCAMGPVLRRYHSAASVAPCRAVWMWDEAWGLAMTLCG